MPAQIATTEDLAALHSELRAIRKMLEGATITPAPEWISVKEYMRRWDVSASTVYRKIEAGELQARGSGKTREVRV